MAPRGTLASPLPSATFSPTASPKEPVPKMFLVSCPQPLPLQSTFHTPDPVLQARLSQVSCPSSSSPSFPSYCLGGDKAEPWALEGECKSWWARNMLVIQE